MKLSIPKHNGQNSKKTVAGYTLIELTVVVFLIGLFLAVALPRFQSALLTDDLKTTTRRIIALFDSLREEAIREQKVYRVHLDLSSNCLWVEFNGMGEEERAMARERGLSLPPGVRILDIWQRGSEKKLDGVTVISFSKKGYVEQSVVHLGADDGRRFTLVLRPFLRKAKIYDTYVDVETI